MNAEFWVATGFVLFVGLVGYLGVHTKLAAALCQMLRPDTSSGRKD